MVLKGENIFCSLFKDSASTSNYIAPFSEDDLLKKLIIFYGNKSFITVFEKSHCRFQSLQHILFIRLTFNIIFPSMLKFLKWLLPFRFSNESPHANLISSCVSLGPPVSFSVFWLLYRCLVKEHKLWRSSICKFLASPASTLVQVSNSNLWSQMPSMLLSVL
jgi:hypothetical protein